MNSGICEVCQASFTTAAPAPPDGKSLCPLHRGKVMRIKDSPIDPKVAAFMMEMNIPLVAPQKAMASYIRDNQHFKQFLMAIDSKNRKTAYEALAPHLNFKAKPYWWLMMMKVKKHAR